MNWPDVKPDVKEDIFCNSSRDRPVPDIDIRTPPAARNQPLSGKTFFFTTGEFICRQISNHSPNTTREATVRDARNNVSGARIFPLAPFIPSTWNSLVWREFNIAMDVTGKPRVAAR